MTGADPEAQPAMAGPLHHIIRKGEAMKIFACTLLLMSSVGFVLMGCSDKSDALVSPGELQPVTSPDIVGLLKGNDVTPLASGSGMIACPWSPYVRFEFAVIRHKDGTIGGRYQMAYLDAQKNPMQEFGGAIKGAKWSGNLFMFYADVDGALFVDYYGYHLGWKQIFVVSDNGEGMKAQADRMSNPWLTTDEIWPGEFPGYWAMEPAAFLASIPPEWGGPDYPLVSGNIQVRVK